MINQSRPRVVKFSGGRSSGMMLLNLLEQNQLDPVRGDVIIFNNTSAEHPATYVFTRKLKRLCEVKYGIPFFWTEYQTYEDARADGWTRLPTYRLVNDQPYEKYHNPNGYRHKGEIFEMLISLTGHVPNMLTRTCTQFMKIFVTNSFISDWFSGRQSIKRLGHDGNEPKMTDDYVLKRHKKNNGSVPDDILLAKRKMARAMPHVRIKHLFLDYTRAALKMNNPSLKAYCLGGKAQLYGKDSLPYVSFLGIRKDEEIRLKKIRARIEAAVNTARRAFTNQPNREDVQAPLVDNDITKDDVLAFWHNQPFNLELPDSGIFSNCVYCPLKGEKKLTEVARADGLNDHHTMTPASIDWWIHIEQKYSRDLKEEGRKTKSDNRYVGFFGGVKALVYPQIKAKAANPLNTVGEAEYLVNEDYVPCHCTD